MRTSGRGTVGLLVLAGALIWHCGRADERPVSTKPAAVKDNVAVFFSPRGGCTQAIVHELEAARESIKIQAYSFTSAPIAGAIVEAQKRGVKIVAVLDKSQRTEKYSSAVFLSNEGVPVYIDDKHAIAHNKIILIDGRVVITGSFNFTKAAEENNAENLLIIRDRDEVSAAYEKNFQSHLEHAQKHEGHAAPETRPATRVWPAATLPAEDVVVFVTRSGKRYHREGCASLAGGSTSMPLSQAKSQGYTACSRCGVK